jgi:tetratricopeptide (TPR) repeat protein
MRSCVLALIFISALPPSDARGQARCGHPDPEISISVCSGIIQSGRASGRELAVAHTERGVAYVTLLDYDRALSDFTEAIRIDAGFARAFANRGAVHGAKQDFEQAIADFTRVLALEPRSAHAYADRAGMHRLNGQHDAAIGDYTEAIQIDPSFAEAVLNRAITLAGTSRCADAIADFTRAIEVCCGHYMNGVIYPFSGLS